MARYRAEGLAGLLIRKGRGRKPAFSPQHETPTAAQEAVLAVVRRSPQVFGYANVRWKLGQLLDVCDWLRLTSAGGAQSVCCSAWASVTNTAGTMCIARIATTARSWTCCNRRTSGVLCAGALRVHLRQPIDLLSAAQSGAGL